MDRMTKVLHFIECNLDADINCQELADIACYSRFHFHRLFRIRFGESVYAFRKRLLLERAFKHLQYSDDSVSTISYKCGYYTQASFNKSFRKQFSLSPSDIRNQTILNKSRRVYTQPEGENMEPEIVVLPDVAVICARANGDYAKAAAEAWGKIMAFAYKNKLMNKCVRMIGISHDTPSVTEPSFIRYDACLDVKISDGCLNENIRRQIIAGGKYAKLIHIGPYENLNDTYAWFFNEWLPNSHYGLRDIPCFDVYKNRDPRRTKPENLKTEVYIPIE